MEEGERQVSYFRNGWNFAASIAGVGTLIIVALFFAALIGSIGYRVLFLNWIENYEIPFKYDARTGRIERVEHTGYVRTPPFVVKVHGIDGRPFQSCINANTRVLNCKLLRFDSRGLETFVEWHGRDAGDVTNNMHEILKSYAFDGTGNDYPFLTIVSELQNHQNQKPAQK